MIHSAQCRAFVFATLTLFAAFASANPAPFPEPQLGSSMFDGGSTPPPVIGMSATGRYYVGGPFTLVNGQPRKGIARFNADGTLDPWAPTIPTSAVAHFAAEDANGNVAVAYGEVGTLGELVYIPAGTQAGAIVDTEPAGNGRQFNRLAFDDTGALYAAVSRRCTQGLGALPAEVRKYSNGARDMGFQIVPANPTGIGGNGQPFSITSCTSALTVHDGQVYVGGFADPALLRASAANGSVDPLWRPAIQGKAHSVLPGPDGMIYVTAAFDVSGTHGLARISTTGAGAIDPSWRPQVEPKDGWAPMAIDPAGGHIYVGGSAIGEFVFNVVAVSLASASVVATWAPNPSDPQFPWNAGVGQLAVLGDRLLVGGGFQSIGGPGHPSIAAVPLATAPVTWPVARMTPPQLDFGLTFREGVKRSRTLTLTNVGVGELAVSAVSFARADWSQTNDCTAPLATGASCTVTVSVPLPVGTHTAGRSWDPSPVFVNHNGTGPTSALIFANNNGEQKLAFSGAYLGTDNTVVFPRTVPGTTRTGDFVLTNYSERAIAIEEVRVISAFVPQGTFTTTNDCPASLPAAGTCNVRVAYRPPSEAFAAYGILRVASDATAQEPLLDARASMLAEDDDLDGLSNGFEVAGGYNPYLKDNDVFANAQLFAMQQYRDFLGRAPEEGGSAYWAARLADGSMTRAALAAQFLGSAEFEAAAAPVTRLYLSYFLRVPDYGGLDFWIARARQGDALESISSQFAASPEFAARYGSLDDSQFVDRVYRNVLGRAPDPTGHAYWTGRLGTMTRGELMLAFSESAEYRSLTTNEVFVTMLYAGMLRRTPEAEGFAHWVSYLDAGNSREALINAVLASPEYRARFMQ